MENLPDRSADLLLQLEQYQNSARVQYTVTLIDPYGATCENDGKYVFNNGLAVERSIIETVFLGGDPTFLFCDKDAICRLLTGLLKFFLMDLDRFPCKPLGVSDFPEASYFNYYNALAYCLECADDDVLVNNLVGDLLREQLIEMAERAFKLMHVWHRPGGENPWIVHFNAVLRLHLDCEKTWLLLTMENPALLVQSLWLIDCFVAEFDPQTSSTCDCRWLSSSFTCRFLEPSYFKVTSQITRLGTFADLLSRTKESVDKVLSSATVPDEWQRFFERVRTQGPVRCDQGRLTRYLESVLRNSGGWSDWLA